MASCGTKPQPTGNILILDFSIVCLLRYGLFHPLAPAVRDLRKRVGRVKKLWYLVIPVCVLTLSVSDRRMDKRRNLSWEPQYYSHHAIVVVASVVWYFTILSNNIIICACVRLCFCQVQADFVYLLIDFIWCHTLPAWPIRYRPWSQKQDNVYKEEEPAPMNEYCTICI